jgi:glycerol-3-phosphate dehydrogenase (NAD(P)+)
MTVRDGMDALIIGGGRMGSALGSLMAQQGRRVELWVRSEARAQEINETHRNTAYLPEVTLSPKLRATTALAESIPRAPLLIMALPSTAFREVARAVGDVVEGDQIIVHTTKGFEVDTFKRMSQILREETCALKVGVLSGPTIAAEILAGHPAGALVASGFDEVITKFQALVEGSFFRVYGGRDVTGTEIAGAFKNVVAVATGAVDGMGFGGTTKWLLVTRGLNEMGQLGVAMGADVLTFGGLVGVGDLAATCASGNSVNYQLGLRLSRGEKLADIVETLPSAAEAIPTTDAIMRNASRLGLELPIVSVVYGLLHGELSLEACLARLMSIPVGSELAAFGPN